ncbi:Crp/Fnr family transcriptional regulator [Phenylobacterium sp.]|uniref:Crp/Fnr family transcriptional regulator n=1 Tax=Phenylobacterium sp. TaxID=1871053 RepID=UPI0011F7405B|nr:Crp/Fnr family transcriptional regulator [Phenylobacterium sp.]THD63876.1 MAG: Crp/Fnr family transcriptional regulator [Phenylobacterium sp.]
MLFRNRILSIVDKADLVALLPHMTEVTWGPGVALYEVGGEVTQVHFPSSAGLSIVAVMADGAEVECATVGYEGAVGILPALSGASSSNRTYVQLAGSGISISAAALRDQAAKSPALLELLLRSAQTLIAQEEQSVACNALHEIEKRLARWLLICHDRLNTSVLSITQEYLAIMLGVQRTTVSAAAGVLRSEGLIRYSRGQIEILDRDGLERRSCECYGAVLRTYDRLLPPSGEA